MPFLAITRQMDGQAIRERLSRVPNDNGASSVAFFQVNFDHAIASAVIDIFRQTLSQPHRLWNELCFFHCRCDGVNGEQENNQEDDNYSETAISENALATRQRNMDSIVQVAMACDVFRQITIKGPAGDERNNNNNNVHNQGGQQPIQPHEGEREGDEVIGYFAFQAIAMGLSFNRKLMKLQFSHLFLSTKQAAALSQGLGTSKCALEMLVFTRVSFAATCRGFNVEHRGLGEQGGEAGAISELAKGLARNKSLHTMAVTSCKLSDVQVACLVTGLQNHPSLTVLRLFGNECRAKGAEALAKLLSFQSTCLESLDLHQQQQARRPSRHLRIVQPLQQQRQQLEEYPLQQQRQHLLGRIFLMRRDVGGNDPVGEDEEGSESKAVTEQRDRLPVELLVPGLRGNQSLRRLNLGSNQLVDDDLANLGNILWSCPRLESLELENNNIGVDGLERFAFCAMPSHLKSLRLQGNPRLTSTGRGPSLLVKILQVHFTIETIDLDAFWMRSKLQPLIQHWIDFNRGGRRALLGNRCNSSSTSFASSPRPPIVPLGLWPKVLERANREFCRSKDRQANVIFHLLEGPVLFEQGNRFRRCSVDTSTGRKRKRQDF